RGKGRVSLRWLDDAGLGLGDLAAVVADELVTQQSQQQDQRQTERGEEYGEYSRAALASALFGQGVHDLVGPVAQHRDTLDGIGGEGRCLPRGLTRTPSPTSSSTPLCGGLLLRAVLVLVGVIVLVAVLVVGAGIVRTGAGVTVLGGEVLLRVVVVLVGVALVVAVLVGVDRLGGLAATGPSAPASATEPGLSSAHDPSQSSTKGVIGNGTGGA